MNLPVDIQITTTKRNWFLFNILFLSKFENLVHILCVSGNPTYPIFLPPTLNFFLTILKKTSENRHVFPNRFLKVWNQNGRTQTAWLEWIALKFKVLKRCTCNNTGIVHERYEQWQQWKLSGFFYLFFQNCYMYMYEDSGLISSFYMTKRKLSWQVKHTILE